MYLSENHKSWNEKAKVYFICIIMLLFNRFAKSQQNVLYLEAGGVGLYGSLNYERLFNIDTKMQLAARLGISSYRLKDYTNTFNPDVLIPIGVSGLYGKHDHRLELGVGEVVTSIVEFGGVDWTPKRKTHRHIYSAIGYRYQKRQKGIMFRFFYLPVLEFNKHMRSWGGCAIGYVF